MGGTLSRARPLLNDESRTLLVVFGVDFFAGIVRHIHRRNVADHRAHREIDRDGVAGVVGCEQRGRDQWRRAPAITEAN